MIIIVVDSLRRSHRVLLELRSYCQLDPEGANQLLASAVVLVNILCLLLFHYCSYLLHSFDDVFPV